jgi:hypothetical protein
MLMSVQHILPEKGHSGAMGDCAHTGSEEAQSATAAGKEVFVFCLCHF